jgi:hypothetical protein
VLQRFRDIADRVDRLVRHVVDGILMTRQGSNLYSFPMPAKGQDFSIPSTVGARSCARKSSTASILYAFSGAPDGGRVHVPGTNHTKGSFKCGFDDATRRPAVLNRFVSEAALDAVRTVARGWDRQALLRRFLAWPGSKEARDMDAAFLGWVKSFTKGRAPS